MSVKDTIGVSTQCEDKRVTRSRSKNFQSIEQPRADINAQSEMYVLDSPIVPNLAMSASTVHSPMSFVSMVSKPDLTGESTSMATIEWAKWIVPLALAPGVEVEHKELICEFLMY